MIKNYVILLLTFSATVFAAPSSNRTLPAQFLKNGTSVLTLPSSGNDVLLGRATTDPLTNKSMDGGSNTFTNLPAATAMTGLLPVANGGTNLASGTSGGVLAYTSTGVLASSGALTANQLVKGGGAGAAPSTLAAGSQYQSLTMGASNPGYSAVSLNQSAAVTGTLPIANGGTNNGSLAVTAGGLVYTDGSALQNSGAGTSGQYLQSNTASPPTWVSFSNPSRSNLISAGSTVGYLFTISTSSGVLVLGDTYTNNGNTYTVVAGIFNQTGQVLWMTNASAPLASGTLTKATSASGSATITFTSQVPIASLSVPATARMLRVCGVGGGGAGGGTTGAANANAGSGGGAGSYACMNFVGSPLFNTNTMYYNLGAAGAGSSGAGTAGTATNFTNGNNTQFSIPGGTGGNAGNCGSATAILCANPVAGGTDPILNNTQGVVTDSNTIRTAGQPGQGGMVFVTTSALGGNGGSSPFGTGGIGATGSNAGAAPVSGFGGGGGGASSVSAGGAKSGGNGTPGALEVYYWYNGN